MEDKKQLINFLKDNLNVFAWSAYEALEVDPEFICNHLNVNPKVIPKKKLPRRSSKQHAKTMKDEVYKFKQARVIKGVFLPRMVSQYCSGKEEIREMARVCGFYRPQ